jgi:hypothetical protein
MRKHTLALVTPHVDVRFRAYNKNPDNVFALHPLHFTPCTAPLAPHPLHPPLAPTPCTHPLHQSTCTPLHSPLHQRRGRRTAVLVPPLPPHHGHLKKRRRRRAAPVRRCCQTQLPVRRTRPERWPGLDATQPARRHSAAWRSMERGQAE